MFKGDLRPEPDAEKLGDTHPSRSEGHDSLTTEPSEVLERVVA